MAFDLTGQRFGMLAVLRISGSRSGDRMWACRCDCGQEVVVSGRNLRHGRTRSCGCLHGKSNRTHGLSRTPIYGVWNAMIQRCTNSNNKSYPDYGGRGIRVCDEWRHSDTFFRWAFESGYAKGLQIDRIDNDGNYEPSNCRWIDQSGNSKNRRNNRLITVYGITKTMTDWLSDIGVTRQALYSAERSGETAEGYIGRRIAHGH